MNKKQFTLQDQNGNDVTFVCGDSFNKGTPFASELLKASIKKLGCGRSVLSNSNNEILAGTKSLESAYLSGIKKVRVVEVTGDELVVVKRMDIKPMTPKGYELSLVDNLLTEKALLWDTELVKKAINEHLSFNPYNWGFNFSDLRQLNIQDFFEQINEQNISRKKKQEDTFYDSITLFDLLIDDGTTKAS